MPDILVLQDLNNRIGANRVLKYFDDDRDGSVLDSDPAVVAILDEAEGEAFSRMLRAYGNAQAIIDLADNDPVFKGHIAWVACELASERNTEFTDSDGWGAFKAQYERALAYFENLSKGRQRSRGEAVAGKNNNVGGNVKPAPPAATEGNFVFAPSTKAPTGHGGF